MFIFEKIKIVKIKRDFFRIRFMILIYYIAFFEIYMPGSLKSGFKSSLKSGEPITYDPGDSMGSGDWLSCGDGDFNDGGSSNTCTESGADSKSGIDVISSFDMSS